MPRKISFLVIGGSTGQSVCTKVTVAGRCLDGPICVGDHFQEVQNREDVVSVALVVEEISAYGKLLAQLDPVVTGELVLSGRLQQPIGDHAVLAGSVSEQ
jgi:hypothetical protein